MIFFMGAVIQSHADPLLQLKKGRELKAYSNAILNDINILHSVTSNCTNVNIGGMGWGFMPAIVVKANNGNNPGRTDLAIKNFLTFIKAKVSSFDLYLQCEASLTDPRCSDLIAQSHLLKKEMQEIVDGLKEGNSKLREAYAVEVKYPNCKADDVVTYNRFSQYLQYYVKNSSEVVYEARDFATKNKKTVDRPQQTPTPTANQYPSSAATS